MSNGWWLDGRDDLRWWQHKHPDPKVRRIGVWMMVAGSIQIGLGLTYLLLR